MSTFDSSLAYRQSATFGASPVGEVVALYDVLLRDLHRCSAALSTGSVEERVAAMNHALMVIGELQGVLDFERGGEPARALDNFYKVVRRLIVLGGAERSAEKFQEAVAMVTRIRGAWAKIEPQVTNRESPKGRSNSLIQPNELGPEDSEGLAQASPAANRRWSV